MLPFVAKSGETREVTARAGLPLIIETMRALELDKVAHEELPAPKRQRGFAQEDKLESLVMLLASGGDRVEDIGVLKEDLGLQRLIGGEFPSADALLDFLRQCDDPRAFDDRPAGKKAFVPAETPGLRGLEAINRAAVERGADRAITTATIDHDGTIIESHNREAKMAYEGTRGYQPLVAVWAEQQLIVADEFRDGNVAGGEDPLSSAKRAFANLPAWVTERYFRADSAAYYAPLLKYLAGEKIGFSVSADMSQELHARCLAVPPEQWIEMETRPREKVHVAEVEFTPGDWPKDAQPLRYITVRFTPLQTEMFDAPAAPKHLAIVTNRDLPPAQLARWHWQKAGTIEHVHRVMKDELGASVMPSSRFGVNAAWFRINALTFNVLTVLKRRALPERYHNARPKRLRFEIFTMPAKLVVHQSQLIAYLAADTVRSDEITVARQKLAAIFESATAA